MRAGGEGQGRRCPSEGAGRELPPSERRHVHEEERCRRFGVEGGGGGGARQADTRPRVSSSRCPQPPRLVARELAVVARELAILRRTPKALIGHRRCPHPAPSLSACAAARFRRDARHSRELHPAHTRCLLLCEADPPHPGPSRREGAVRCSSKLGRPRIPEKPPPPRLTPLPSR